MALQKQAINLNFAQGLDLKTDPNQVSAGKFLALDNAVFNKGGLLQKRNGFQTLSTLPTDTTTLATLNGSLLGLGQHLYAYAPDVMKAVNQGKLAQALLTTQSLARSSQNITSTDLAVASTGLACTVSADSTGAYFQVNDFSTGQTLKPRALISSTALNPRVFLNGNYFIITYTQLVSSTPNLLFIAIPISDPTSLIGPTQISSQIKATTSAYDGVSVNNTLYLAWDGSDLGGAIRMCFINYALQVGFTQIITGANADLISVQADTSGPTPNIWCAFVEAIPGDMYILQTDHNLLLTLSPTLVVSTVSIAQLTMTSLNDIATIYYEIQNDYATTTIQSDYIQAITVTNTGSVGSPRVVARSVGLAARAFTYNGQDYLISVYAQALQPTYFVIDANGNVIAKLAYGNAITYAAMSSKILPTVTKLDNLFYFPYLFKATLVPVNKAMNAVSVNGIYAQAGVNLATLKLANVYQANAEIANALNLTGGFPWLYDASSPTELGFHVYPEDIKATWSSSGGSMVAKPDGSTNANAYFYQVTYEWTDAQGNLHRSATSIPLAVTTVGSGTSGSVSLEIPTLRLTYKTSVRIVVYRWSIGQQIFYQVTSVTSPLLNDPTVDTVTYVDTLADSSILGNVILYTTGGVLENIAGPACSASTLWKSRYWLVDSEDQNLLWYSKPVQEDTPTEMTDLQTVYVAPTSGQQTSTGPITALSAMDDKLIIFKKDAIYYMTGDGPDITGANNNFSDPVFITSTVGCSNPQSIVLSPIGIMFQSDKGIWLLGRDLSTRYIGADVESYNANSVLSAVQVPGTNQVRFNLSNATVLMYDYYYEQWGTFSNVGGISSVIFQGLHTYINSLGQVKQELPGSFIDTSVPVVLSFSTAWIKLTGLQGFQRAYFLYLLSNYLTPHMLQVSLAYDYNPAQTQSSLITPTNNTQVWGDDPSWGASTPYGGGGNVEQQRVFFRQQKCQAIQVSVQEIYDPTKGLPAGGGLTMSGINIVIGAKKGYPTLAAINQVG